MYINKLIKKQVMLILATVVLVGTLAVTTSFAVFEETKSNATDQKMTIGNLDVTYTGGSAISITDINPMTDSTALSKTNNIYTFTIKNTGTVPYNFKVKVVNNPSYTSNLLPHQYIRYSLNNGTASTLGSGQADYELTSGVIEAGATNTYNLRLWVADASTYSLPNSALGQEIHLKISVEGKAGRGWLPSNFKDRILALNEVKTPITTPGKEISSESEALLASTEDDYGTSYYFRGAVKNNYVQFANKCWRVVRINGDNSVKLVLHNDNTSKAANPCAAENNSAYAAFAHYDGDNFETYFNEEQYTGFIYNNTKSTALINLEKWYDKNLTHYENYIENNKFCNDTSHYLLNGYDPFGIVGSPYDYTYFGATYRLLSSDNEAGGTGPSFKCPNNSDKIESKIGLMTADEYAFAGLSYKAGDDFNYLLDSESNSSRPVFWCSLSPSMRFDAIYFWYVRGSSLSYSDGMYLECALRPVVNLAPTTKIGGIGTSEDPYIVK